MTLKFKKKFFNYNWFWCQLHGIYFDNINKIDGDFVRYSKRCEFKLSWNKAKKYMFGGIL